MNASTALNTLALRLLNPWQRDFPLIREPYAAIAERAGLSVADVLQGYAELCHAGALSRIGGVFATQAGGAAVLAAMAVPEARLDEVAAIVSSHPGVNHNYERENHWNLWFVLTGPHVQAVHDALRELERTTVLPALALPMVRSYRIDLGFDLRESLPDRSSAPHLETPNATPCRLRDDDLGLAALVEEGLPLIERPFDDWAQRLGSTPQAVLARLTNWLARGSMSRFGAIVRHHELGFAANAMTVFDVPDDQVDRCGQLVAGQSGVTLAYRRERARDWPYNLYCMVHGRDRTAVAERITAIAAACGLDGFAHQVLFSRRRFKQSGGCRFRPWARTDADNDGDTRCFPHKMHAC